MSEIIARPLYMERIRPFIGKELIKVFVGQRRVGKSCLMLHVQEYLRRQKRAVTIINVNKELHEFDAIRTAADLIDYAEKHAGRGRNALFVDEVQEIVEFERALRSLNATGKFDLYCTGSNANLLSRELSTLLAGRCVEIQVFALTYGEFLSFHNLDNADASMRLYLKYGGLPYLRHFELCDEVVYDYLRNIYQTILYRDIVSRHQIRNCDLLERLVTFLGDNVGSLVSAHRISAFLKSQRLNTSPRVILEYLSHLTEACFVDRVPRYDIKGKRRFEVNDKYYFGDLGLRNAIVGYRPDDINKLLENVVYHHLRAHGYTVTVGTLDGSEIDFVAEKKGQFEYYQVAYLLSDETVVAREFGNLAKIPDQYPKYVVTLDPLAGGDRGGIRHVHLRDFLSRPPPT
ncbi:MAG: ATP-binding protein [Lentisphaeria bacterium]